MATLGEWGYVKLEADNYQVFNSECVNDAGERMTQDYVAQGIRTEPQARFIAMLPRIVWRYMQLADGDDEVSEADRLLADELYQLIAFEGAMGD